MANEADILTELRLLREQNAGLIDQVQELRGRQEEMDALVRVLGCDDERNQRSDRFWRDVHQGALALSKLLNILSNIGRWALLFGGMTTVAAAMINNWKGGP